MHFLAVCAIAVFVLAMACIMYSFIITAIDKATNAKLHAPTTDRRFKRRMCVGSRRRCLEPSKILLSLLTESFIIAGDVKYAYTDRRDKEKLLDLSDQELIMLGITSKKKKKAGDYYLEAL